MKGARPLDEQQAAKHWYSSLVPRHLNVNVVNQANGCFSGP